MLNDTPHHFADLGRYALTNHSQNSRTLVLFETFSSDSRDPRALWKSSSNQFISARFSPSLAFSPWRTCTGPRACAARRLVPKRDSALGVSTTAVRFLDLLVTGMRMFRGRCAPARTVYSRGGLPLVGNGCMFVQCDPLCRGRSRLLSRLRRGCGRGAPACATGLVLAVTSDAAMS